MFKKIQKESTTDKVAQQLCALIENGTLKPGDKIPSERELCKSMSISRISVREAIKGLVGRNLLEVRSGEGTYVKSIDTLSFIDPLAGKLLNDKTLHDIFELRWVVEVQLAGFAARRADKNDVEKIEYFFERMKQDVNKEQSYLINDLAFHNAIAQASKNELLASMLFQVQELIGETIKRTSAMPGVKEVVLRHEKILQSIKNSDVAGAKRAMSDHLKEIEFLMRINCDDWEDDKE